MTKNYDKPIFVSIHFNSAEWRPSASGIEVYVLPPLGFPISGKAPDPILDRQKCEGNAIEPASFVLANTIAIVSRQNRRIGSWGKTCPICGSSLLQRSIDLDRVCLSHQCTGSQKHRLGKVAGDVPVHRGWDLGLHDSGKRNPYSGQGVGLRTDDFLGKNRVRDRTSESR